MRDNFRLSLILMLGAAMLLAGGCSRRQSAEEQLERIAVDSLEGVLTGTGVTFDEQVSSDGKGSLRIVAEAPTTVRLYEVEDPDVEDGRLIYRAKLRTEAVQGAVYLEMWCRLPDAGEFFSRGLHSTLTGTTEWTSQELYFSLEKGQNPDLVKLNVVIDGKGTVWVDDIVLAKGRM